RKAALFLYLARDATRVAQRVAPPFACLSPPRWISRSTPCVDAVPAELDHPRMAWIYPLHCELRVKLPASPAGAFPHDR
ncbi:hypothetical protein, partial [Stenotrophomonas pavanii]|uniref:hypothetical protein n=1 Tax=Stenotrophomonas pavanii TaxID=487698 RepID=UPI0039EFCD87